MAELKITSWNVRNFGSNLMRPGVRGHGLELKSRIRSVVHNIESYIKPDILFIIEAGPDGNEVAAAMNKFFKKDYSAVASDETSGERYILVLKNGLLPYLGKNDIIGKTSNLRKGFAVETILGKTHLLLTVLHAPAPKKDNLDTRLRIIKEVGESSSAIAGNNPVLFMGDLNIKMGEQQALHQTMQGIGFAWRGPSEASGQNQVPVKTSSRLFSTILKNSGYEDTDSEPYDQFWLYKNLQVNRSFKQSIVVASPETKNLIKWVSDGMREAVITGEGRNTYRTVKIEYNHDIMQAYSLFQGLASLTELVLNGTGTADRKIRNALPIPNWIETMQLMNQQIEQVGLQNVDAFNSITVNSVQFNTLFGRLKNFLKYQILADGLINYYGGNTAGEGLLISTIYEHAISDHYPISTLISVA